MRDGKDMVKEQRMVIQDEDKDGVEKELRRSMWELINEINNKGKNNNHTTHYMEEAEQLCRNIAIIDEGKIIEKTSMKSLLADLDSQVYILDSAAELPAQLSLDLPNTGLRLIDGHSFEVTVSGDQSINEVFSRLDQQGVQVSSMRNKTNRLEQLFLARLRDS